jgi:hypothetical protein
MEGDVQERKDREHFVSSICETVKCSPEISLPFLRIMPIQGPTLLVVSGELVEIGQSVDIVVGTREEE